METSSNIRIIYHLTGARVLTPTIVATGALPVPSAIKLH